LSEFSTVACRCSMPLEWMSACQGVFKWVRELSRQCVTKKE
jgi:hypothetical protein